MTVAGLESLGAWVWGASWRAAVVVVVVLGVRLVVGRRLSPRMRSGLWLLVAARLVMVWAPQGSWSLFGVLERITPTPPLAMSPGAQPTPNQAGGVRVTVGYHDEMAAVGSPVGSAVAPIERPSGWGRIAAGIWLSGAVLLLARAVLSHLRIARRIAGAPVVDDPHTLDLLERCRRDMRVGRSVGIRVTDAIGGPALWGVVRPTILLPPGLADRLSAEQLRFVFLHELAHVRRHDVLVEWLLAVLTSVHWFNPAIWLAAHLYRADRELCRDQMVLTATGMERRRDYGHALLALLELAQGRRSGPQLAVAMLGDKGRLEQRIGMIAQLRSAPGRWVGAVLLVGLTVAACVLLTNPKQPDRRGSSTSATTTDSGTNRAATDVLDRPIARMEFRGERLDQTIDRLRDVSGANIFVEWGKLAAAGVARETPISARMRDVSLAKVLRTVLSDAGGGNVRLAFSMDAGVIRVSTAEALEVVETRAYDIRDLLVDVPDFDPGKPPETPQPRAERVAALTKLIRETIDPRSWTPTRRGSIVEDHGQLVVAQTTENHAALGSLLDQLRETRQIQVVTQTRFVSFDPTALAGADPAWEILRSVGEARQATEAGGTAASPLYLSPEQMTALLAEIGRQPDAATLMAPRLTTFNGQRAFVKVATQRAYVGDLTVKRDEEAAFKGYDPVVESAEAGMTVDLQATASADRKYLTVTVRPKLSKLVAMHDVPFANVPVDHPAGMKIPTIQRPELLQSETKMTISIPDGQTLVLGGGEDVGLLDASEGSAKPKAGHRMYIFVTPKLIYARPATR